MVLKAVRRVAIINLSRDTLQASENIIIVIGPFNSFHRERQDLSIYRRRITSVIRNEDYIPSSSSMLTSSSSFSKLSTAKLTNSESGAG